MTAAPDIVPTTGLSARGAESGAAMFRLSLLGAATIALRCADPRKYLELYGKFLEQQPSWVSQEVRLDPIFKVASQVGMTRGQFDACRENQSMIDGLKWVKERGRQLGVVGTPNFFIEGTLVKKVLTMGSIMAKV